LRYNDVGYIVLRNTRLRPALIAIEVRLEAPVGVCPPPAGVDGSCRLFRTGHLVTGGFAIADAGGLDSLVQRLG
jgi:hypothetical protein